VAVKAEPASLLFLRVLLNVYMCSRMYNMFILQYALLFFASHCPSLLVYLCLKMEIVKISFLICKMEMIVCLSPSWA
jgi:hypothetical protein